MSRNLTAALSIIRINLLDPYHRNKPTTSIEKIFHEKAFTQDLTQFDVFLYESCSQNEQVIGGGCMAPTGISEYDKDFMLLNAIEINHDTSQRDLAHKTGLSLGSVNLLIRKMIREGLIKMEQIPVNRVIYMLTPKGLAEKADKTLRYAVRHYNAIQETKQRIRRKLDLLNATHDRIFVCQPEHELKDLVKATIIEYIQENPQARVLLIDRQDLDKIARGNQKVIVLYLPEEPVRIPAAFETQRYEMDMLIK